MEIIAITGKKGKTSVVRLLTYILEYLGNNIISLDNDFYSKNGNRLFTINDSKEIWGIKYMARCPGRWLGIENKNIKNFDYFITEAASGCYKYGLGYEEHNIGVFTNLDSPEPLLEYGNTREKLAFAKGSFIFGNLKENGIAVFDSDNKYICNELKKYDKNFIKIGIGLKSNENLDVFVKLEKSNIKIFKKEEKVFEYDFKNAYITFNGLFFPSLQNIAIVLGVLFGTYNDDFNLKKDMIVNLINNYKPKEDGGRLVVIKKYSKNIIVDYAHDKFSFIHILKLIKKFSNDDYKIFFDGKDGTKKNEQFLKVIKDLKIPISKVIYIDKKSCIKDIIQNTNEQYILFLVSKTRDKINSLFLE